MDIKFAIITCSDTRDVTEDEAGAALEPDQGGGMVGMRTRRGTR